MRTLLATFFGAAALAVGALTLPGCSDTTTDLDDDSIDYSDELADPEHDMDGDQAEPAFSSGGTDREFDGYEPLGEDVREAGDGLDLEPEQ